MACHMMMRDTWRRRRTGKYAKLPTISSDSVADRMEKGSTAPG